MQVKTETGRQPQLKMRVMLTTLRRALLMAAAAIETYLKED